MYLKEIIDWISMFYSSFYLLDVSRGFIVPFEQSHCVNTKHTRTKLKRSCMYSKIWFKQMIYYYESENWSCWSSECTYRSPFYCHNNTKARNIRTGLFVCFVSGINTYSVVYSIKWRTDCDIYYVSSRGTNTGSILPQKVNIFIVWKNIKK